jgi:predicted outer membrane protein
MKHIICVFLFGSISYAQQATTVAKPATPTAKKPALLSSDMGGRDMLFINQAIEHGKTLTFLAMESRKSTNPELKGFGENLVKSIAAQSAVLNSLADLRSVRVAAAESPAQTKYAARLAKLEGPKRDKALLEAFVETDERVVTTYELAEKSPDPTIKEFVSQTLPQMREHLTLVRALAGIPPQRPVETAETEPAKPAPVAPGAPAFRAK